MKYIYSYKIIDPLTGKALANRSTLFDMERQDAENIYAVLAFFISKQRAAVAATWPAIIYYRDSKIAELEAAK